MSYVLWLPSWYPSREDAFTGDFIERHAHAASLHTRIEVLVMAGTAGADAYECVAVNERLRVHYCYIHHKPGASVPLFVKKWKKYQELTTQLFQELGKPQCAHVHVSTWAGAFALWLKRKHGIAYYLTEHWSGFRKDVPHTVYRWGKLKRMLLKRILRGSQSLLPVSDDLKTRMIDFAGPHAAVIVRNVVDTHLFHYAEQAGATGDFTFVHVSGLGHPKNPEGMLRAFCRYLDGGGKGRLQVIGPVPEKLQGWMNSNITPRHYDQIVFEGELPYEKVAEAVKKAQVMVLFSNYENFPCVIIEALCCGVPVLATQVGGIPEALTNENGRMVTAGDEVAFAASLHWFTDHYVEFDRNEIAAAAVSAYSYDRIGRQLSSLYNEIE